MLKVPEVITDFSAVSSSSVRGCQALIAVEAGHVLLQEFASKKSLYRLQVFLWLIAEPSAQRGNQSEEAACIGPE
jgi:hypothetical protein